MSPPVRRSPVSAMHEELGATMDAEAGWELVAHYGSEDRERALVRDAIALVDATPRGKVDVHGALDGALSVAGGALVARVAEDWALVLAEPGGEEVLLPKIEQAAGPGSTVTDATHLFAAFAMAGPGLEQALRRLTSWDPSSLLSGAATGAPIADVRAVVVRRDLELPVVEVLVPTEVARYVWETSLDAVRRAGGGPAGWSALRAEGWS